MTNTPLMADAGPATAPEAVVCSECHRPLRDRVSRAVGIGPVCDPDNHPRGGRRRPAGPGQLTITTTETRMPGPALYRRRPIDMEAIQWTGDNAAELHAFAGSRFAEVPAEDRGDDPDETAQLLESTHSSWVGLLVGDWVGKVDGGFHLFSAETMAAGYDRVAAPAAER